MEKYALKKMKEEFISNVSHELRTPLAIAKGSIELVMEDGLGPEQKMLLSRSKDNLDKLNQLIDDLITISQLKDSPKLELGWVDIEEGINECLIEISRKAAVKEVTVKSKVQRNLPCIVGDKRKITKVFSCILDNAVKFSRNKGEIIIGSKLSENSLIITFQDDGIGIPKNEMEKIFECFYQVDGSTKRRYNGMGLGLAIADKIVSLHGGRISVRSKNGIGTIFTVEFPTNGRDFRKLKDKVYI
jgi:signal transduction histidine kinase